MGATVVGFGLCWSRNFVRWEYLLTLIEAIGVVCEVIFFVVLVGFGLNWLRVCCMDEAEKVYDFFG